MLTDSQCELIALYVMSRFLGASGKSKRQRILLYLNDRFWR